MVTLFFIYMDVVYAARGQESVAAIYMDVQCIPREGRSPEGRVSGVTLIKNNPDRHCIWRYCRKPTLGILL